MIRQALCALVLLAIIFTVTFNLEVREMGLASNFFACSSSWGEPSRPP